MARPAQAQVDGLNPAIRTAGEALQWAPDGPHPRVARASGLGAEDAAATDMTVRISPKSRLFTLDAGRLPKETHGAMGVVRRRHGVGLEVLFPDAEGVGETVRTRGASLFCDSVESRNLRCAVRRARPTNRILEAPGGWMAGLRRDQTSDRAGARMPGLGESRAPPHSGGPRRLARPAGAGAPGRACAARPRGPGRPDAAERGPVQAGGQSSRIVPPAARPDPFIWGRPVAARGALTRKSWGAA